MSTGEVEGTGRTIRIDLLRTQCSYVHPRAAHKHSLREMRAYVQQRTYARIFAVALFLTAPNWTEDRCPPRAEGVGTPQRELHAHCRAHLAVKNGRMIHAATWGLSRPLLRWAEGWHRGLYRHTSFF